MFPSTREHSKGALEKEQRGFKVKHRIDNDGDSAGIYFQAPMSNRDAWSDGGAIKGHDFSSDYNYYGLNYEKGSRIDIHWGDGEVTRDHHLDDWSYPPTRNYYTGWTYDPPRGDSFDSWPWQKKAYQWDQIDDWAQSSFAIANYGLHHTYAEAGEYTITITGAASPRFLPDYITLTDIVSWGGYDLDYVGAYPYDPKQVFFFQDMCQTFKGQKQLKVPVSATDSAGVLFWRSTSMTLTADYDHAGIAGNNEGDEGQGGALCVSTFEDSNFEGPLEFANVDTPNNPDDSQALLSLPWGQGGSLRKTGLRNFSRMFADNTTYTGNYALNIVADLECKSTVDPALPRAMTSRELGLVTRQMFSGCTALVGDISSICPPSGLRKFHDVYRMFEGCTNFNQDLSYWSNSMLHDGTSAHWAVGRGRSAGAFLGGAWANGHGLEMMEGCDNWEWKNWPYHGVILKLNNNTNSDKYFNIDKMDDVKFLNPSQTYLWEQELWRFASDHPQGAYSTKQKFYPDSDLLINALPVGDTTPVSRNVSGYYDGAVIPANSDLFVMLGTISPWEYTVIQNGGVDMLSYDHYADPSLSDNATPRFLPHRARLAMKFSNTEGSGYTDASNDYLVDVTSWGSPGRYEVLAMDHAFYNCTRLPAAFSATNPEAAGFNWAFNDTFQGTSWELGFTYAELFHKPLDPMMSPDYSEYAPCAFVGRDGTNMFKNANRVPDLTGIDFSGIRIWDGAFENTNFNQNIFSIMKASYDAKKADLDSNVASFSAVGVYQSTSYTDYWRGPRTNEIWSAIGMFRNCTAFNQPVSDANMDHCHDISFMFEGCTNFNQPINWRNDRPTMNLFYYNGSGYNLTNTQSQFDLRINESGCLATGTFKGCTSFNSSVNIEGFLPHLTESMFEGCTSFNSALTNFDMTRNNSAAFMFKGCTNFNQPDVSSWVFACPRSKRHSISVGEFGNVTRSGGTDIRGMFMDCSSFNQDLSSWSNWIALSKGEVFDSYTGSSHEIDRSGYTFPQDGASHPWPATTSNVGAGYGLAWLFTGCSSFNQDLSSWGELDITSTDAAHHASTVSVIVAPNSDAFDANTYDSSGYDLSRGNGSFYEKLWSGCDSWETKNHPWRPMIVELTVPSNNYNITVVATAAGNNIGCKVDWGDGTYGELDAGNSDPSGPYVNVHTYATAGTYQVAVYGGVSLEFPKSILTDIIAWGDGSQHIPVTYKEMFKSATNLGTITAADSGRERHMNWANPDMFEEMFNGALGFNGDLSGFDTSSATNFKAMLQNTGFNSDISGWDMSSATKTNLMFNNTPFNQPLNSWDVSSVTNMNSMFANTSAFNQPLNNWDTSNVQVFSWILSGAAAFNQDLSGWDTSSWTANTDFDTFATSWQAGYKPTFS